MKGAIACRALPVRVEVDIKMLQTCWQPAGAVRQQPALGAWAASAAAAEEAEPSSTGRAGHIGMRKVRAKVGPPATMASRPAVAGTYPETHQPVFNILITAPVTISWDGWRHRCGRGVCWALSFSNGRDTYPSLRALASHNVVLFGSLQPTGRRVPIDLRRSSQSRKTQCRRLRRH